MGPDCVPVYLFPDALDIALDVLIRKLGILTMEIALLN